MTGLILVVDDVPANVKLLEAKLTNEYYDVITAKDGFEAIQQATARKPDLILLDVMMPGMDGFETCRRMKEDPTVSHIPVVMVTALSEASDRVRGLEAGADDFITKPINDMALFARVRSLIRIKMLIDELRLRDQSKAQMGVGGIVNFSNDLGGSSVMLVEDEALRARKIAERLAAEQYHVHHYADHRAALDHAQHGELDLVIISNQLSEVDGLRLATQFKAIEAVRHVPIIMLVDEHESALMLKGLDLGMNDYLTAPLDYNEMIARVKTQLRRKKYQDALRSNYEESVSMAVTDSLTRLYNRHYLDTHLKNLTQQSLQNGKPMSLLMMDMDHFKKVNDTYGHDVGDEVLRQLSQIIIQSTRSTDLAARFGGEEFVVLMPETDGTRAAEVAERMRKKVESTPFIITHSEGQIHKTVSIGLADLNLAKDTPDALLKRADTALYKAKNGGRNQVVMNSVAPAAAQQAPAAATAQKGLQLEPTLTSRPLHPVPSGAGAPPRTLELHAAGGNMVKQEVAQATSSRPLNFTPNTGNFAPASPQLVNAPRAVASPVTPVAPALAAPPAADTQSAAARQPVHYDVVRPRKKAEAGSPVDDEPPGTF